MNLKKKDLDSSEVVRIYTKSNKNQQEIAEIFRTSNVVISNILKDFVLNTKSDEKEVQKVFQKMEDIYFYALKLRNISAKYRMYTYTDRLRRLRKELINSSNIQFEEKNTKLQLKYWNFILEGNYLEEDFPYSREEIEQTLIPRLQRLG